MTAFLTELFKLSIGETDILLEMREALIFPIFKQDKARPKNYRSVPVSSHLSKLWNFIVWHFQLALQNSIHNPVFYCYELFHCVCQCCIKPIPFIDQFDYMIVIFLVLILKWMLLQPMFVEIPIQILVNFANQIGILALTIYWIFPHKNMPKVAFKYMPK